MDWLDNDLLVNMISSQKHIDFQQVCLVQRFPIKSLFILNETFAAIVIFLFCKYNILVSNKSNAGLMISPYNDSFAL